MSVIREFIPTRAVFENDEFGYSYGMNEHLKHTPAVGDRGKKTHYYRVAILDDNSRTFAVITADNARGLNPSSRLMDEILTNGHQLTPAGGDVEKPQAQEKKAKAQDPDPQLKKIVAEDGTETWELNGVTFDPEIHGTKPDGTPSTTPGGQFRKRRAPKKDKKAKKDAAQSTKPDGDWKAIMQKVLAAETAGQIDVIQGELDSCECDDEKRAEIQQMIDQTKEELSGELAF